MGNREVNIYIETFYKGPAKRRTTGAWIVEYLLQSGKPVTRGGILYADMATENEMTLMLLKKAFSILTKTCCIRVFTKCSHVLNTMQNHWLWQWQKNNWRNAKGARISNEDMWRECALMIEHHMTEWTGEEHSYERCMRNRLEKETAKEHETEDINVWLEIAVPEWNTEVRVRA